MASPDNVYEEPPADMYVCIFCETGWEGHASWDEDGHNGSYYDYEDGE